jgi:thymidine phosphorylase
VAAGVYSDLQLAAFVTATAGDRLDEAETIALTQAMLGSGERIRWDYPIVADKHSVGGLPGNRTTPLVVAMVAACGVPIPKTSSRAITSPAGTADTMEVLAPVDLDVAAMRRVVEKEGGCIVWGGAVRLSPADDVLIRVERPLDFDSEGQLVASVLSKKAAAGSTHVVIDMPVGPTAKVRSADAAQELSARLRAVGSVLGLKLRIEQTDGSQPVGRGIGPALEARDVLAVLQNLREAPQDLRERALKLAGAVLELANAAAPGQGPAMARAALDDGRAWRKFQAICEAQGGMREPPRSSISHVVEADARAAVAGFDNRRLARLAKLAGAPTAPAAGLDLHVRVGDRVVPGQPLFTVHAEATGELAYALDYLAKQKEIVMLERAA